jgi:hypothetical protein
MLCITERLMNSSRRSRSCAGALAAVWSCVAVAALAGVAGIASRGGLDAGAAAAVPGTIVTPEPTARGAFGPACAEAPFTGPDGIGKTP